jgi:hypothetical protein
MSGKGMPHREARKNLWLIPAIPTIQDAEIRRIVV